jgi:hypothetical protein
MMLGSDVVERPEDAVTRARSGTCPCLARGLFPKSRNAEQDKNPPPALEGALIHPWLLEERG